MIEERTQVGLSRDLIIHPGETLEEYLLNFNMSQKELAIRCGVSEKHISSIISGSSSISVAFARKLEYALGVDADFWINLQANYEKEIIEFEDAHNITAEELDVLNNLKYIKDEYINKKLLEPNLSKDDELLAFRKLFNVSNLLSIPKLTHIGAFRIHNNGDNVDTYALYAWEKYCELIDANKHNPNPLDIKELANKIPEIKKVMFSDGKKIIKELMDIFYSVGINFYVVKTVKGIPVQGYIRKNNNNGISLYMTIRNKFADIFWLSLFHEIGHIMNNAAKNNFVDFNDMPKEIEDKANSFAEEALISNESFDRFITENDYSVKAILKLAKLNNVQPFIILGRLMNENIIKWNSYSDYRIRYELIG